MRSFKGLYFLPAKSLGCRNWLLKDLFFFLRKRNSRFLKKKNRSFSNQSKFHFSYLWIISTTKTTHSAAKDRHAPRPYRSKSHGMLRRRSSPVSKQSQSLIRQRIHKKQRIWWPKEQQSRGYRWKRSTDQCKTWRLYQESRSVYHWAWNQQAIPSTI